MPDRTLPTRPTLRRLTLPAASAGALAIVGAIALPASAHVGITPSTTAAGGYAILTVSVPHGCDGSATTKIAISMPEEIPQVTATRNPYWNLDVTTEPLDEPITDAHGNEITERESVVTYTARTPLPDPDRDTFELSVQLPDAVGETLAFPIIQTCEQGEVGWTEVAQDGQSEDELESPASLLTITEAEDDAHGAEAASDTEDGGDAAPASAETDAAADEDGGDGLAIAGLVAGIAGIAVGGFALARGRRTS